MMSVSLAELAVRFGCSIEGDPDIRVSHVAPLQKAGADAIAFFATPSYRRHLGATRAGAVILAADWVAQCPTAALITDNPHAVYARVARILHPAPAFEPGVAPSAVVAADAQLADGVYIGPQAVVESGARIAERVFVGPGCIVGRDCRIGADSRLVANVTVCHGVELGARNVIYPGAVIGGDGFGLAREGERSLRVPQLGTVRTGEDVEIGANTTVDRGALEDTIIEDGVKLDNQIQVAHNVRIGAHTVVAACTGISGSTDIGKRCLIAGAVGFVDHKSIADDVVITGQTMVNRSIAEPGIYSSALPMDEARRWRRNAARFRHLDELARRLKDVEKQLQGSKGERECND